ncbi:hypothetical protein PV327_005081 [Microctonus hyperodae]|uniref:RNA helicase n=1 Tax=Microctonus hyperodae TaxID=165561 RepID=A0AA39KZ73_MICHY|nr:hypothetical protein PV327_005081 [Microctonus hyperodae]
MNPLPLKSYVRTPKVVWYQADDRIVLRIMLAGVQKYSLNLDLDHIKFSTKHDDKLYYLCLYFFGAVIPEKTIHQNLGREIKIQIPKAHKFLKWLRLHDEKRKNPQITIDPDKIEDTTWVTRRIHERPWTDFEEYKRENKITNIMPAGSSSDSDSSDDERFVRLCD